MHLKNSFKYQLNNFKMCTILISILYIAFMILDIILAVVTTNGSEGGAVQIFGYDIMMLSGLGAYAAFNCSKDFNMQTQNGISRKTFFLSRVFSGVVFSLYAMVFVFLSSLLFKHILGVLFGNTANQMYMSLFLSSFYFDGKSSVFTLFIGSLLLFFCLLAVYFVMTFFGALFYRVNNIVKVFVVVIPVLLINIILPIIEFTFPQYPVMSLLFEFMDKILGVSANNPITAMITYSVVAVVFAVASFLVIRRIPVKK